MNLFGISFILVSCLSSLCVQPALANWPVFYIEKGGTAVVPCVPKGDETAYFWSKGVDFATSQSVASRVLGIPSSDSEKYLVNEDGSLVIYNVTLAEGGRYHCRIVSENTNCRGAVSIEVTVNDFTFGIDQCEPSESCTLKVRPSKETKLTCTAKGGPPSLSLKWFNGSKEMNSASNEHPLNEESSTVSETITVSNEFGLPLTCEAVASEDGQACARLAHVRLDNIDTDKEHTDADKSSALWIVLLVLVIVETMFTVYLLKYIYAKKHRYKQRKESFNTTTGQQKNEIGEKDTLLEQKDGELADLQDKYQKKIGELKKASEDLSTKNATITQKDGELATLQDKFEKANGELKKARDDLSAENTTITQKDEELVTLQEKFQKANGELKKARDDLSAKNTTITQKDGELATLQDKFQKKNGELKKAREDLSVKNATITQKDEELVTLQEKFQKANGKLKKARDDLSAKNTTITQKDEELASLQDKFQKANGELKKARDDLSAKNTTITKANGELKKARDDLSAKNTTITQKDEELATLQDKFQQKDEELATLQEKFQKTTGEPEQVKKDLTEDDTTVPKAHEELENVKKDPTAKNSTPTGGSE